MATPKSPEAIRKALSKAKETLRKAQSRVTELERALSKADTGSRKPGARRPAAERDFYDPITRQAIADRGQTALFEVRELVKGTDGRQYWAHRSGFPTREQAEAYAAEQTASSHAAGYGRRNPYRKRGEAFLGEYAARELKLPPPRPIAPSAPRAPGQPRSWFDVFGVK
jgi:hypothetical protein